MALHPGRTLVASGDAGARASVHVWDTRTLATEAVLAGGQRDGIGAIAFTPDGSLLACADLSPQHTIALWNWRAATLLSLTRGGAGAVLGLVFSPKDSSMVSFGQRHVRFWSRPLVGSGGGGGGWSARKGAFGAAGAQTVLCAAFVPSTAALLTGTSRGMLLEWTGHTVSRAVRLHSQWPIFAIAISAEGVAVGGRGGRLLVWPAGSTPMDPQLAKPVDLAQLATGLTDEYGRLRCLLTGDAPCVRALAFARGTLLLVTRAGELWQLGGAAPQCRLLLQGHCALRAPSAHEHGGGARSELWALAAHPQRAELFVTAGDDCTVRVWDAAACAMQCMRRVRAAPQCAAFSPDGTLLAVGGADGTTLLLEPDSLTELPIRPSAPHAGEVTALAFTPDSALLAVGYADGSVEVHSAFAERGAREPLRLLGAHVGAARSLDWSEDGSLLQSCCEGMVLAWWDVEGGGERIIDAEQVSDVEWATWTAPVGWPVVGILPQLSDGTDVHGVSRSNGRHLVATADDFGKLNLFAYPSAVAGSACRVGAAHAGHVSNVCWSCDDSRLFSTGGADMTVLQWRVGRTNNRLDPIDMPVGVSRAFDNERG